MSATSNPRDTSIVSSGSAERESRRENVGLTLTPPAWLSRVAAVFRASPRAAQPSGSRQTPRMQEGQQVPDDGLEEKEKYNDRVDVRSISSPGGLPVEYWLKILEIVDDPRALLASGCTCKALRDVVAAIVNKRRHINLDELASDPTHGYFKQQVELDSTSLTSWLSTYDIKSLRFSSMSIIGPVLSMSSQTRSTLSLLHSVTFLRLQKTHFVSFSEFARTVCALPNLSTLELWNITIDTSRSYSLNGVYFARALHLKRLQIHNCAFNESHPIWNLLTAPSLSDSLVTIDVLSAIKDLDPALRRLPVPPALLLSANLGQLTRMHFDLWTLSCEGGRDVAVSRLFSRSPVNYITSIEISYHCDHSSPHLNEWGLLFLALDDAISATKSSVLKTVTVSFKTTHPFDFDYVRAAMDSQSYSAKWEEMFMMSSVTFIPADLDGTSSSSQRVFIERAIAAERRTEGLNLAVGFGDVLSFKYKATVIYTRRSCS